jgi:3-oxoacyl-[acyl-carrier-protein] synthase II
MLPTEQESALEAQAASAWADTKRLTQRRAQAIALGPHGFLSHHLTRRIGIEMKSCTVAACASSLIALHQARCHLLHKVEDSERSARALVLTAESALHPLFIHSYRRLGVLAPLSVEGYRGRPLNRNGAGFMLGSAGAAVLLRALPIGESPRPGQIMLIDTNTACEAVDTVRSDPQMSALRHVAKKVTSGKAVDVIHPHASGTAEHDPAELAALQHVFGSDQSATSPSLYAAKGAIGHSLGSAGLSSLILACLAAKTRRIPPMPWLEQSIALSPFETHPGGRSLNSSSIHAIFAAGFAGHTAGAVIRSV